MVIGKWYSFDDIAAMIRSGFSSTAPTAALFVFSILFFGIMNDTGLFDVLIRKLMAKVGGSVIGVTMVTAVITLVCHLDCNGASTFCILIPAMLPVYRRMHMRETTLLRIGIVCMGAMNLLPWSGASLRTATVLAMEGSKLWHTVLPVQLFSVALSLGHAFLAGIQEKARDAGVELLVPVPVVRRFHWTCSNIRNIARFRSILTYILSSCCSQKGVRPLFCGIGLQALFTGRRSLPTSTNP